MGNKTKVGKQRKDKYYHLAKDTGYRSRAAFKLVQLNRKFEFLQTSRVCIDLCAAPGGWMQVARETMPVSCVIVGVDLFPIKPVSGCISLQEDITTDKCRVALQRALQTWKADVILNDGAPNVGKNWLHDAYQQACLTLSALKLATHFLRPGGWFVTKVFRSRDYNPLLWVLKQLFKKVHATKPQASRSESAEIFVVCQYYLAPEKLDARFLDPKHVFEELDTASSTQLNVFHPEKEKKAKAEGYPENNYLLRYPMPVSEFLASEDGVTALQKATEITFDDEAVANDPKTTVEVKECCKDLRVLGRKDMRTLLSWWKALRGQKKAEEEEEKKKNGTAVEGVDVKQDGKDEEDEDEALDTQVEQLELEQAQDARRKRKQTNKLRHKLQTRMDLKMVLTGDEGPQLEEINLFALNKVPGKKALKKVVEDTPDIVAESDPDSDVEEELRVVKYSKDGPSHLHSSGTHYTEEEEEEVTEDDDGSVDYDQTVKDGLGLDDESSDDDKDLVASQAVLPSNPLITDLDPRSKEEKRLQKAALWFQKDAFKDLELDEDIDLEVNELVGRLQENIANNLQDRKAKENMNKEDHDGGSDYEIEEEMTWNDQAYDRTKKNEEEEGEESDDGFENDWDDEVKSKKKKNENALNNPAKDGFEIVAKNSAPKPRKHKMDAESLALGALMVTSKRIKRDIVDAAWNRYAFNDDHLPDWFKDDEENHMRKKIPVPENLVGEYRKRQEELNVRPIKKIVEAKARKKKRALQRLEKAKKKVAAIMENVDMSEREKARQVKQLYRKARDGKKQEVTYVVAKKHTSAKRMRRPPGMKGPYKVVDPRMKKDDRKRKQSEKDNKKKGKGRNKAKGTPIRPAHRQKQGKGQAGGGKQRKQAGRK